jgi:uncharacterized protein (DUF983 family)
MPKKILKNKKVSAKKILPTTKPVLEYMKGKFPVCCPNCKIKLLRDENTLKEKCGNCLQEVTYEKTK